MANFRFRNAWSDAARLDPRYRDPTGPVASHQAVDPPAAEMITDQAAAELPRVEALPTSRTSTWSGPMSPHASGPRKITEEVLTEALRLHQAGESWPAIARRFGCHRMALYHALRR